MPELPEVESARQVIDRFALGRRIVDVDDADTYVCRPHRPGEIRGALVGRQLTSVHRRGKSMWCETSGLGRSRTPGPVLGIHLGMAGRIVAGDGRGGEVDGGDYWERGRAPGDHRYARFCITYADGGYLMLVDPRRFGRIRLDPPTEELGPDAAGISRADFRSALMRGTAPVKARLLDQAALAGVGNILADQALWQARLHPARSVSSLSTVEVDRLHGAVREAVASAIGSGGVHNLSIVAVRRPGGQCPRCGAPMARARVGGRTTWWCSREQA